MKTYSILIPTLFVVIGSATQQISARVSEDSGIKDIDPIVIRQNNDTTESFVTLHENGPHLKGVPDVPRFALIGKQGKYYLGIGANIKAVGAYDIGSPISNPNLFITSAIPMDPAPGNGGKFSFSAQQSNIYLNVVALPGNKNQLGAYVSMTFLGNNYTPSLQHAYLKYRGITAGYTYSMFTDAAACPATIDYEGPNAMTCQIHGNIYYELPFGKRKEWKAGVGIDMPCLSATYTPQTAGVTQRVPDIPIYIQRSWSEGKGWLRLSGIIRNLYYRNTTAGKNIDRVGWGVKASGMTPIGGGLSVYYQAVYGKGIASYIQDLEGTGMDLMPSASDPTRLDAIEAWGAYGGLQYNFSSRLSCAAIYSHVRTYAEKYSDSATPWGSGYKYAQYVLGNVMYNINSIVQVGVEYLWGRRVNFDGHQAHDNRIEGMLQVNF